MMTTVWCVFHIWPANEFLGVFATEIGARQRVEQVMEAIHGEPWKWRDLDYEDFQVWEEEVT